MLQSQHLLVRWLGYPDPHEFGFVLGVVAPLVDGDAAHSGTVAIEKGGYDRHARPPHPARAAALAAGGWRVCYGLKEA